jgi:hypothetical protein
LDLAILVHLLHVSLLLRTRHMLPGSPKAVVNSK